MGNTKKTSLNIIIVGCGKVGVALVEQLIREGHDITVIDSDSQRIQEITSTYDIMGMAGNGASYSVQMEAGIEDCDLLIAVTGSDELNLLCCTVAKRVGDCAAIARVRNPDYSKESGYLREKLGLALIINPDLEAAKEAARILSLPTALNVDSFAHGLAELISFTIPEDNMLNGMSLIELSSKVPSDILICAVERGEEVHIPSGNFILRSGDNVSFTATRATARKFLKQVGFVVNQAKSVMIIGGGKTAYYLAKQLLNSGVAVKIIESDRARCEELSILLPKAVIINGDGTNEDLLHEEGIANMGGFVPLTGIDEENIVLTLFANRVSKAKVITKIDRITFKKVISSLNLGSVMYPHYITSEAIIAYVRAKKDSMGSNIETLNHMFDQRVEAIEFRVDERCAVTDIPLKNLELKKELLIACINRKGAIIIPSGQDCIKVGDTVIIVTAHTGFNDIENILR
ncbi:MAG: Trk system potassium transporter TrkA [Ruminococcaceae bacterium]|nr:Trk system potassium transporter TrkA [Oscillospiraceae bacterium]